jgi:pyridoxamine 5'-phosphate oxidase
MFMQFEAIDVVERPRRLASGDFTEADDPFQLFSVWFEEAARAEPCDPNAMTLATVDADGTPNARMILLKGVEERGFVFFTHTSSVKGCELAACPRAALVFHWKSLKRQVRVRGLVEPASAAQANDYFASRPRQSQIGAWASRQSTPLESRLVLEAAVANYAAKYSDAVPRPPHWCGYRVVPLAIEFWQECPFRLHDRVVFKRTQAGDPWTKTRLYP